MRRVELSIVCLLAIAVLAISVNSAPTNDEAVSGTPSVSKVRAGFSPAKLFDFDNYKAVFHKTYSGMLEELVRAKYFLSRAFRAFISAIKYKYRQSPYYLAVNEMSDWTPDEIQKAENKILAEESESIEEVNRDALVPTPPETHDDLPELLPENVGEAEKELKRMAESAEPGSLARDERKELAGDSSSPGPTEGHDGKVRDLPMEKLIDTGTDVQLNLAAARKLTNSVPSDNPQYVPLELPSFGLADEPTDVKIWSIKAKAKSEPTTSLMSSLTSVLSSIKQSFSSSDEEDEDEDEEFEDTPEPDEVFVDLRDTGCLTLPRRQGKCGSCWAFAAITIFEYIYCMKTGKLVPFSEQYMIDCGKPYIAHAGGCEGGTGQAGANFVKNFGLELRTKYPYSMRNNQCPYEESTDLKHTGYIRFEFDNAVRLYIDHWPTYLENSPIWTGIVWLNSFNEYGGGVFGWGCDGKKASHAVVVVGHGREDGEEYWLIRNSHSVGWGEGGYGKLAKSAGCTVKRYGYIYASQDGLNFESRIKKNKLNDRETVKGHYVQNLML